MSASISLCSACGQFMFGKNSRRNKRTNRNEVNQERTWSSDVNGVTRCFVTVDNEWVLDVFHLVPVCNV